MSFWTAMLGGQVRYVEVHGVRTRILEAGDEGAERFLVLLHGTSGHAENWLQNVVALGANGYVVAPDLLGHGFNSRPDGIDYTFQGLLDHAAGLIRELGGGRRADVLGMSLGGTIGALLAVQRPELVRTNVMLCPPMLHPKGTETSNRSSNDVRQLFADPQPELVRERFVRMLHRPEVIDDDFIATRLLIQRNPDAAKTVLPIVEDFNANWQRYRLDPVTLGKVACPSLFVWGRYNHPGPEVAEEAVPLMPAAELIVMEHSGHWPHVEDKDEFEARVSGWLAMH